MIGVGLAALGHLVSYSIATVVASLTAIFGIVLMLAVLFRL